MTEPRLTDLLRRFAAEEPHRARGGVLALAGFEFQIHAFLLDFVDVLINARAANVDKTSAGKRVFEAGRRFAGAMEALSDHLRPDGEGGTVAVQVKRTLTRATLQSAAREAVTIDRFLERQVPGGVVPRSSRLAPDADSRCKNRHR